MSINNRSGVLRSAVNPYLRPVAPPRLLVELDPAHRVFLGNLGDLLSFRRPPRVAVSSRPAPFWPDVFVPSRSLWWPFLESMLWHVLAGAAIWALAQGLALQTHALPRTAFNRSDVIYYAAPEPTCLSQRLRRHRIWPAQSRVDQPRLWRLSLNHRRLCKGLFADSATSALDAARWLPPRLNCQWTRGVHCPPSHRL